jgi:hypothetical protein
LPPLILLSGDSFSQETKWFSVFHLLISHPTSLTTVIAVTTALRPTYVKALLGWLGGSIEPSLVDKLSTRLDATLEFVTFVTQEFLLLRNYKPVKLKHITYGLITKRGQPAPVVMWSQECDRRNRAVVS